MFCSVCLKQKCPLFNVTHCEHEGLNILTGFLTNPDTLSFFLSKKSEINFGEMGGNIYFELGLALKQILESHCLIDTLQICLVT